LALFYFLEFNAAYTSIPLPVDLYTARINAWRTIV
jgi:hypothetical protein